MTPPWKLIALLALVVTAISLAGLLVMAQQEARALDLANRTVQANINFRRAFDYLSQQLEGTNQSLDAARAQVNWLRGVFIQNQQEVAKTLRGLGCEEFRNATAKDGTPIEWAFRCRSASGQVVTVLLGESLVPPQPTPVPRGAGV